MVPLKAIQLMAQSQGKNKLTSKQIKTQFEELLLEALKDQISNVRFTACRVVQTVIIQIQLDSDLLGSFKEILEKLKKSDSDEDVQFFARQALESMN